MPTPYYSHPNFKSELQVYRETTCAGSRVHVVWTPRNTWLRHRRVWYVTSAIKPALGTKYRRTIVPLVTGSVGPNWVVHHTDVLLWHATEDRPAFGDAIPDPERIAQLNAVVRNASALWGA